MKSSLNSMCRLFRLACEVAAAIAAWVVWSVRIRWINLRVFGIRSAWAMRQANRRIRRRLGAGEHEKLHRLLLAIATERRTTPAAFAFMLSEAARLADLGETRQAIAARIYKQTRQRHPQGVAHG